MVLAKATERDRRETNRAPASGKQPIWGEPGIRAAVAVMFADGLRQAQHLCRRLGAQAATAGILLFAAADGPGPALEDGAEFWSHEWDVGLLGLQVEAIERSRSAKTPPGGAVLHVANGFVFLRGVPLRLTGKPLRFASCLVERAAERLELTGVALHDAIDLELVTREELAHIVWRQKS